MIILNIGSNIGQRSNNIDIAISMLSKKLIVKAASKKLYSKPVLGSNICQGDYFVNIGLEIYSPASPLCLLSYVKEVEISMGRCGGAAIWSSRIIDIDIILFNDQSINSQLLHLPHKEILNRDFVLLSLLELAPRYQYKTAGNNHNIAAEELYKNLNNLNRNII